MLHHILKLRCFAGVGNEFEIANTITDGYFELMRVHDTTKRDVVVLPIRCFRQEIFILGEQHTP